jgi:L-threonylcarbamoyladenylate synthase
MILSEHMSKKIILQSLISGEDADGLLQSVVSRIEAGEVFVYPTETIYGIGGRADSEDVRKKIIKAKRRPPELPLILLAGHKKIFMDFNVRFSPLAQTLARHFWPGNLTMVLPFENSASTIGVRVSDHPFIQALYKTLQIPLFSTSANLSGQAYVNDPAAIYSLFEKNVDCMIDAGVLPPSPPSTVIKIRSDDTVEIVREGKVSKEQIVSVIVTALNNKT